MRLFFLLFCSSLLLVGSWQCQPESPSGGAVLFTAIAPEASGIQFQNTLTEGPNTNILMYEYFYNGGGVATGDFNEDGLIDVYFTANMSDNKLYLNKGNLQFKDITAASGAAGRPGPWKTGVTVVDINGDQKLDLYISYSGMLPDAKRTNQLLVNLGNDPSGIPHFEDRATAYGLASTGYSNQAYFFDADKDGDLDMLLLNHNPKSLPVLNEIQNAEMIRQNDTQQGVRFYRQEKGTFTDMTLQSGIRGSALTYGLGIAIADINRDGWPDFYISNDYAVPDYLYINNKNGTFTDKLGESMGHTSQFSMGNDVGDINNDGWPDIVTLDMLPEDNHRQKLLLGADNYEKFNLSVRSGFHRQYMRNMLQLNNGNGTFSEIGQQAGIANTDWSWAALLADYDNDGWKDLFITNGYYRDYTNLDFIHFMDNYVKSKGRMLREDVKDLVSQMPSSNVVNYAFANKDGLSFSNKTSEWGMNRPSNSNGAAYADFDNDGDLDLVVNNINQPAFLWRNNSREQTKSHFLQVQLQGEGQNTLGIGAAVTVFSNGSPQTIEQYPTRGYLSAVSPVLHFGLGTATVIDSLHIVWPNGKSQIRYQVPIDQKIILAAKDAIQPGAKTTIADPLFKVVNSPVNFKQPTQNLRDFNRQNLLTTEFSFSGPCLVKGDVNADGLEDLLIGGAAGQGIRLFLQKSNGAFSAQQSPAFDADAQFTDAALLLLDANGDGAPDLYAASTGYHQLKADDPLLQDRLYINNGKGGFSRSTAALPDTRTAKGCAAAADINSDGFPDIFVGGRVVPGRYPEAPRSYLLINDGNGHFSDQTANWAPSLANIGMVTDAVWADLDTDSRPELVLAGEWMPITVYGIAAGKLEEQTNRFFEKNYRGWWNCLAVADINGDQKPDLVAGNWGWNSQVRASEMEPADLFFSDFDSNGSVDPILCFFIQGKSYPYVTRDELGAQLPRMKAKFNSYKSYADAELGQIFEPEALQKTGQWRAEYLSSSVFLSGNGQRFSLAPLPAAAQVAPVHALSVADLNGDGHQDLLVCGNNSHTKLRLGQMDANYGVVLLGDGTGHFNYLHQPESGLSIKGDVRTILPIGDTWLLGITEGPIQALKINRK